MHPRIRMEFKFFIKYDNGFAVANLRRFPKAAGVGDSGNIFGFNLPGGESKPKTVSHCGHVVKYETHIFNPAQAYYTADIS